MGQKSSKADLFVTDDVTRCSLSQHELKKYVGRPREYTAVDVVVETPSVQETNATPLKKGPSPNSAITLLNRAHKMSYHLAFVIPKIKGSKTSTLARHSFIEEEPKSDDANTSETTVFTHTVFLFRPKIKSRNKKESTLKHMEATKTILNVMLENEKKSTFVIKDFTGDLKSISTGEYVTQLQDMVSEEAKKGGRLLSVMRVEMEPEKAKSNGEANNLDQEDKKVQEEKKSLNTLSLRMLFLQRKLEECSTIFQYSVASHNTKCKEQKLKLKKSQPKPKSSRDTNVTWTEDWLELFRSNYRLIEVVNVGELSAPEADSEPKKQNKLREFEVNSLCFYEKPVNNEAQKETEDKTTYPDAYDGLVREVWAPLDNNLQTNLENEASTYGDYGWELCTLLATSHVRMKPDGSEFQKCIIFFQRPKQQCIPETDIDTSRENLCDAAADENDDAKDEAEEDIPPPPTSPKDKAEKFGVVIMKAGDLDLSKLKSTSKTSPKQAKKEPDPVASSIAAVQLKKVDRDKIKKPEAQEENAVAPQVKLRHTEVKSNSVETNSEKEVPWMASLEKKRKAVMESEEQSKSKERLPSTEANGEIAQKIDEIKGKKDERENEPPSKESDNAELKTEEKPEDNAETPVPSSKDEEEVVGASTVDDIKEDEGTSPPEKPEEKLTVLEDKSLPDTTIPPTETVSADSKDTLPSTANASDSAIVTPSQDISSMQQKNETALSQLNFPSPPPLTGEIPSEAKPTFEYPENEATDKQIVEENNIHNEVKGKESPEMPEEVTIAQALNELDVATVDDTPLSADAVESEDVPEPKETLEPEDIPAPKETPASEDISEPKKTPESEDVPEPKETNEAEDTSEPKETSESEDVPAPRETPESEDIPEPKETNEAENIYEPKEAPEPEDISESKDVAEQQDISELNDIDNQVELTSDLEQQNDEQPDETSPEESVAVTDSETEKLTQSNLPTDKTTSTDEHSHDAADQDKVSDNFEEAVKDEVQNQKGDENTDAKTNLVPPQTTPNVENQVEDDTADCSKESSDGKKEDNEISQETADVENVDTPETKNENNRTDQEKGDSGISDDQTEESKAEHCDGLGSDTEQKTVDSSEKDVKAADPEKEQEELHESAEHLKSESTIEENSSDKKLESSVDENQKNKDSSNIARSESPCNDAEDALPSDNDHVNVNSKDDKPPEPNQAEN